MDSNGLLVCLLADLAQQSRTYTSSLRCGIHCQCADVYVEKCSAADSGDWME